MKRADRGTVDGEAAKRDIAADEIAAASQLEALNGRVIDCRACERLVQWREQVAREKRASFRDEKYWGRPIVGLGDPEARLLVLGLAPAAHGGNRTGRIFTGDRSGDWLFAALHRAGFANQPTSVRVGDGLRLRGCYVTAGVRCAPPGNHPSPDERAACLPFLVEELGILRGVRAILCLGGYAWETALRALAARGHAVPKPRPRFGHLAEAVVAPYTLVGCYHPSQQNTFTGRLTVPMTDEAIARAGTLAGCR